jgi:hypothetical protein
VLDWSHATPHRAQCGLCAGCLRPHILRLGIADERELDRLDAAARTHLADPDVLVMPSLNFLAWGRKTVAA